MAEYVYLKNVNGEPFKPVTDLAALDMTATDGIYVTRTNYGTIGLNYSYVADRLFGYMMESGVGPAAHGAGTVTPPAPVTLVAPTFTHSPTTPTNGTVTITATFQSEVTSKFYKRPSDSDWQPLYGNTVSATENGDYQFYGKTSDDRSTPIGTRTISNIDTQAPTIQRVWMTTTGGIEIPAASTQLYSSVRVCVSATDNLQLHSTAYAWKHGGDPSANTGWTTTSNSYVTVDTNETVYVKVRDAAGNWSAVSSYVVNKILAAAPAAPVVTHTPTGATNGNITITATASGADVVGIEWKASTSSTWTPVIGTSMSHIVTANGTWKYRAYNSEGTYSSETSHTVSNIDRTPPVITLSGYDNQNAGVTDTTITAAANETLNGAIQWRYGTTGAWAAYTQPVEVVENGTYNFQAEDVAGNVGTASVTFTNIETDERPPDGPPQA